jgi:hypothetical protein
MKPSRGVVGACALVLLGLTAGPAQAGWANVFQVTCFFHKRQPPASVSYFVAPAPAAPCCDPCPQPCPQPCTTSYVQRCYYQPVTAYQTRSYFEPVTTYRTSFFYEPVTSYRYSCYFDPCSCSFQQVATPTTSFRLRSQTSAVQSWVQRCCQVPVTTYQQAFYWEPVTTCCTPTGPAPSSLSGLQPRASGDPVLTTPPPLNGEARSQSTPGVSENPYGNRTEPLPNQRYYPPGQQQDYMPPASGSSYRQIQPNGQALPVAPARPTPPVRIDRIAAVSAGEVQGQVVRSDKLPAAGAKVLFVSADRRQPRQTAAVDKSGQFRVALTSGGWLVYVQGSDGKPMFDRKIDVRDQETRQMELVSR